MTEIVVRAHRSKRERIVEMGGPECVLLNAAQVARVLGISKSHAYNLMDARALPTVQIGGSVRVNKARLLEWVERNTVQRADDF